METFIAMDYNPRRHMVETRSRHVKVELRSQHEMINGQGEVFRRMGETIMLIDRHVDTVRLGFPDVEMPMILEDTPSIGTIS